MSTRAIVALPTSKGFITAWCWNDGGPNNLGRELREHFKDENDVRQLLKLHSFSSIWGPRSINDVVSDGDTAVALSNSRSVLMHSYNGKVVAGKGRHGFFRTVDEMLGQDLNYVYVFEKGKWKMYK